MTSRKTQRNGGPTGAFDFSVVGGGSAGCVGAARLGEGADNRALLIESGGRDKDPCVHIRATFCKVIAKGRDAVRYVVSGNPNAPTIMIGERPARFLLQRQS